MSQEQEHGLLCLLTGVARPPGHKKEPWWGGRGGRVSSPTRFMYKPQISTHYYRKGTHKRLRVQQERIIQIAKSIFSASFEES